MSEPVFDTPMLIKALHEPRVDTAKTPSFRSVYRYWNAIPTAHGQPLAIA